MKLVFKVLVALVVLAIAYRVGTILVRQSNESASAVVRASEWNYDEEVDPITKQIKAKAIARLAGQSSAGEPVVAAVSWDCSDGTTDTLRLEITTFLNEKDSEGKLKPFEQDEEHAFDYRFDGVASSISSQALFSGATIRREYRNSVQLFLLSRIGSYGRDRYPGLYVTTAGSDGNAAYRTKAFYIVDSEFVARIPTQGGTNVVIQFTLEDPSIKRMLTKCGLTYGPAPIANNVKSRELSVPKGDSAATNKSTNLSSHIIRTGVRLDPKYPLKIGRGYYPAASLNAREEGRCVVKVRVTPDGWIADASIQTSTGFQRLDDACITAVRGQRLIPATENGKPVETTASVPIEWKLNASE